MFKRHFFSLLILKTVLYFCGNHDTIFFHHSLIIQCSKEQDLMEEDIFKLIFFIKMYNSVGQLNICCGIYKIVSCSCVEIYKLQILFEHDLLHAQASMIQNKICWRKCCMFWMFRFWVMNLRAVVEGRFSE